MKCKTTEMMKLKIKKSKKLKFVSLMTLCISLMMVNTFNVNADDSNIYHLGEVVNAGKDTGFSEENEITKKDPHYNWDLGSFYVNGFTRVITNNGKTTFLKTVGDNIKLNFTLKQNIDALNGDDSLVIADNKKDYDNKLYKDETNFGRGALIIRKTDAYQNKKGVSQLYTNYLSGVKVGANTEVEICEEGDYEVSLDYSIRDKKITIPIIDQTIRSTYTDYKIAFTFSVRNGNCMVFPFDVTTGEELTNKSITENGFYLDLAKSRYLEINIKKEVLNESAMGLTEDVRFNKPARDGEKYTDEGIYTITVYNEYTGEKTLKKIYVGSNSVLKAYITTGYSISDIQSLLDNGASVDDNGKITIPHGIEEPEVEETVSNSPIPLDKNNDTNKENSDLMKNLITFGSVFIVLIVFVIYSKIKQNKKDKRLDIEIPDDPEEIEFRSNIKNSRKEE